MKFIARERIPPVVPCDDGKILYQANIRIHRHGRLSAKLLVFRDSAALVEFWKTLNDHELGKRCGGAVYCLARESFIVRPDGTEKVESLECDRRYFCVVGLVLGRLTTEIIAHESVHAGFAYERRVRRNLFGKRGDFEEERIAYPAGIIASEITEHLRDAGFCP